jgi:DNA ligase-associated metallophosphoesterase
MNIQLMHETFTILPEAALYWPRQRLIAISDVHIGKAGSMQKIGVPIPSVSHNEDFYKIRRLIETYHPEQILILGDLVHHPSSWGAQLFTDFRNFFSLFEKTGFTLIAGNHERGSEKYLNELPIRISYQDVVIDNFCFSHGHHENDSSLYRIEGHIHPLVELRQGPTKLRLKCFVQSPERLVLPAFGALTGGYAMEFTAHDKIYAIAGTSIVPVPQKQFYKPTGRNP